MSASAEIVFCAPDSMVSHKGMLFVVSFSRFSGFDKFGSSGSIELVGELGGCFCSVLGDVDVWTVFLVLPSGWSGEFPVLLIVDVLSSVWLFQVLLPFGCVS